MVIIFYDSQSDHLYICTEQKPIQIINVSNIEIKDIIEQIPDDDILYVSNGHLINKLQFQDWLEGNAALLDEQCDTISDKESKEVYGTQPLYWVRSKHAGVIQLLDIPEYPEGLIFRDKWEFVPVDAKLHELLSNSRHFKYFINKGKIEKVDANYVKQNQHRRRKNKSATDTVLDRMIIKDSRPGSANKVSKSGGMAGVDIDGDMDDDDGGVIRINL